jgi:hypothetical protein
MAAVLAVCRLRRLEFAFARHLGANREDLAVLVLAETLVWMVPLIAGGISALAILARAERISGVAAWHGVAILVCSGLGCAVGAVVGGALNSERQLFKYFQRRT